MANLSNINNILRVSSSGVGINKNNTGPSELDIESAGADIIDMTRTNLKTYRFAISGASAFSLFDVAAGVDRLIIDSSGDAIFAANVGINTGGATPDRVLDVRGNGLSIFGSGSNTELMLRGQVEGTGTIRNLGAWHWSVRSDVGGDNDDLKLLRFNTGTFAGTAMQIRSDNGGVAIGLNNEGYASQILSVKSGAADNVFYGESSDANCFASFRDSNSTANIEFGAIGNSHVFRNDTTEKMRIDGSGKMTIPAIADGIKFEITSSAGSGHSIIEMGQVGSDGFLDVSAAGGGIVTHLSGYTGYASYFLSNVGIGTSSPNVLLQLRSNINTIPANTDFAMRSGKSFRFLGDGDGNADYGSYIEAPTKGIITIGTRWVGGDEGGLTVNRGNVGIGETSPSTKLQVFDSNVLSARWYKGSSNFSNPFIVIVSNMTSGGAYPQISIKISLHGHGVSSNATQWTESLCTYDISNGSFFQTNISHTAIGPSQPGPGVFSVSGTSIGFTPNRQTNYDQYTIQASITWRTTNFDY